MPRTLNPETHAVRRDTFVDAALRLISSRGYEQLSIRDVIDELGASKGAFYHYFDSKGAFLAAVVERMVEVATGTVAPIATDPHLSAPEQLQAVFSGIAHPTCRDGPPHAPAGDGPAARCRRGCVLPELSRGRSERPCLAHPGAQ